MPRVPDGMPAQPASMREASLLHPMAPTLAPTRGMPGAPRTPLDHPASGAGFENSLANLPGVPLDAPRPEHGGWAERPGAGGNPGFGLSGPGKLSPLPPGGGSVTPLRGAIGNAGALRPGPASTAHAGRGGGAGGGSGGTYSPIGGGGSALSDGGVGNLPGSAPKPVTGGSGNWAETVGSGGQGGGGHTGGPGFAALGPGHGPGRSHGGGGASQVGAVGHGTGLTPGVGAGRGPDREGVGGGSGGGLDGNGTPSSGGDPLGEDARKLPIAASGGVKGTGSSWEDQPGSGKGLNGAGQDLAPAGPSYSAKALEVPAPSYPALAIKEHQQGTVVIALSIGISGQIEKWTFLKRSPSDALDNAALKALRRVKYRAALHNGVRVPSTVTYRITFKTGQEPEVKQI